MTFHRLLRLVSVGVFVAAASEASAAIKIVATTEDLASVAREVGGDKITVDALARGYQDPHFVEAKPSFILKLHAADLLVLVGRELENAWLPPLITQSRNAKIRVGGPGYLDASIGAHVLEIPTGQITRAMGDVHPLGNPHYWLSPENGRHIAQAIQKKLSELSPKDAAYFAQRYADFDRRLTEAQKRWQGMLGAARGTKVVTYHRSWSNFCDAFGIEVVGYVEPRPGIPPSPFHTLTLIQEMKRMNIKIILVEPYFDLKTPNAIARDTGAKVVVMPPSVGGVPEVKSYFDLFDYNLRLLVAAIKETGGRT